MKVGVTSQNFRTVTGHAGKTRRFLVYHVEADAQPTEVDRFDLPKEMAMHEFRGWGRHPIDGLDVVITGSCGEGFLRKMAERDIKVITTSEPDPLTAVIAYQRSLGTANS